LTKKPAPGIDSPISRISFNHTEERLMGTKAKASLFTGEVTERTLQKWRSIQIAAIFPMIVFVVLLFYFRGSKLGILAFFLLLIIGVIVPQIYRDMIQSHLVLQERISKFPQAQVEK
jgi:ABC-type multidrug transport system fused ATPase/permease subunit